MEVVLDRGVSQPIAQFGLEEIIVGRRLFVIAQRPFTGERLDRPSRRLTITIGTLSVKRSKASPSEGVKRPTRDLISSPESEAFGKPGVSE